MTRRRLAAIAALALGTATVVFAIAVALGNFPNAIAVPACLALAVVLRWYGIRRRGIERVVGLSGRLGKLVGSGTRPRMDERLLGAAAVQAAEGEPLLEWSVPEFEVGAGVGLR